MIRDDLNSLYTLRPAGGFAQNFPSVDQALDHARSLICQATFITLHDARGILVSTFTIWPDSTTPTAG